MRRQDSPRCVFHSQDVPADDYLRDFRHLLNVKDGNWRGFQFPDGVQLHGLEMPNKVDEAYARFRGSLDINECHFRESVDFSHGAIGTTFRMTGTTFHNRFEARQFGFEGDVWWGAIVTGKADFSESVFRARAAFSGAFSEAIFAACSFGDYTSFRGGWNRVIVPGAVAQRDEVMPLFVAGGSFEGVDFKRPERVSFAHVDLSKVRMTQADFSGVSFIGVQWPQIGRRQSLYDEKWITETKAPEDQWRPRLESAYRNIRVSLESSKDFNTASDFYIGEMTARRKQLSRWRANLFSIPAVYRYSSRYGCAPGQAFCVLLGLLIAYALLWGAMHFRLGHCPPDEKMVVDVIKHGFWGLPALRPPLTEDDWVGWSIIPGAILRILILGQLALCILSLRGRIKRG